MKKFIIVCAVVVVIIIAILVLTASNLGPIIKTAINTQGPKITKTEVSLSDVGISIFSGEAKIKDFHLGNPKGFKSPYAVSVGSVFVDVDETSLTGDTIIIDKIEVTAPEITYEKAAGTDNFKALLDNLKGTAATGKPAKKPAKEATANGKKIMIRDFILTDGKVNLATTLLGGKSITASLPDIHLKDLGKETGGTSPAEAFEKIFAALRNNITSPDVTKALNESLKAMSKDIEAVGEDAKKQVKAAGEDIKAAADDAKKQAEAMEKDVRTTGEDAKKQAEDMEKDLKTDLDALSGGAKKLFGD